MEMYFFESALTRYCLYRYSLFEFVTKQGPDGERTDYDYVGLLLLPPLFLLPLPLFLFLYFLVLCILLQFSNSFGRSLVYHNRVQSPNLSERQRQREG